MKMIKKQMVVTDINKCKITNWKEGSNHKADWEKFINEAKVHIGL